MILHAVNGDGGKLLNGLYSSRLEYSAPEKCISPNTSSPVCTVRLSVDKVVADTLLDIRFEQFILDVSSVDVVT